MKLLTSVALLALLGCQMPEPATPARRTATLYDGHGRMIKSWTGELSLEARGGLVWLRSLDGTAVVLGGTFIIEEEHGRTPSFAK